MIIGTVRIEESKVYDSHGGYHQFHTDLTQKPFGSFEVFWDPCDFPVFYDADGAPVKPGWYWWACFPGCIPDGEPCGPYASSQQAHEDADEWAPEYNA